MPRSKLKKFKKLEKMLHVIQPNRAELLNNTFSLKGNWKKKFSNSNPICLELGCGKGEYSVSLAKMYPNINFIGIDIKGSRIYSGAEVVVKENLKNVIFIRTQIEYLESIFSKNEVSEIWITFPDPQLKYNRRRKRLIHPYMLNKYKCILQKHGILHLKTDSLFLYGYTLGILEKGPYKIIKTLYDIYGSETIDSRLEIKTHYEDMFLNNGQPITYLAFSFLY